MKKYLQYCKIIIGSSKLSSPGHILLWKCINERASENWAWHFSTLPFDEYFIQLA